MGDDGIRRMALGIADAHGCHTAILYGSRARGDATPESDIDLVCVRESGPPLRDARIIEGVYMDAFIYPESVVATPEPAMLRILPGIVLREREGFGTALLARLQEIRDRGPAPLAGDERTVRVVWAHKTLERIRRHSGPETDYRRMSLLLTALEDYFALRGAWFDGPRTAFAWLLDHDARTRSLFEEAMRPTAPDAALADLVLAVYGRP